MKRAVIRLEVPAATDALIQARVVPLLPAGATRWVNRASLQAIVRALRMPRASSTRA